MIHNSNGHDFFVNDKLFEAMQKFTTKRMKKKDNNKIFLFCGDTGVGKSSFAFQLASVLDPKFSIDNIHFTVDEMKEALKTRVNRVVIFDEAFRGASGRNVMGKDQKELLQMFYEIRQLNQIVFLISPSFFRLDEAIAVELSDIMFYVHKSKSGRRSFRVFNNKKKNKLYYRAKKGQKSYRLVPTMFNGNFPNTYVVAEDEYRQKKLDSLFKKKASTLGSPKKDNYHERLKDREPRLWATLVKHAGSYGEAVRLAKEAGIVITRSTIHEKIAEKPELLPLVGGN